MKKDLNPDIVPGVVEDIKASGLKVQAFFLLGYPGESIDDIKKTSELIKKCRFNFVFFNQFQPLPGTPVYKELVAKNEILNGFMPHNYSDGSRAYTHDELKDFNFSLFIIKTYFFMVLRDPLNIFYVLTLHPLRLYTKKLYLNLKKIFLYWAIHLTPTKND